MSSLMLNSLAPSKKASGPRPLPKAGTQVARVLHVVDMGTQQRKPFKGEDKGPCRQLWVNFELVNDKYEYDGELVPHRISLKKLNVFNDPKSALFKFMNSIDPANDCGGDLGKLVNKTCLVTIIHAKGQSADGETKTYANITNVSPVPEGLPVPEAKDKPCLFSYATPEADVIKELPKFILEDIAKAAEYPGSKTADLVSAHLDAMNKEKEAASDKEPY